MLTENQYWIGGQEGWWGGGGGGGVGVTDVVYKLENLFTSMGSFHFSRSYESVLMVDYFAQPNNLIKNTTVRMGK